MLILLKYIVVGAIISLIVGHFYPTIGLIIAGLFLIGMFPAAYKDFKEVRLPKIQAKNLHNHYKKLENEFKGFEESLRLIKREL